MALFPIAAVVLLVLVLLLLVYVGVLVVGRAIAGSRRRASEATIGAPLGPDASTADQPARGQPALGQAAVARSTQAERRRAMVLGWRWAGMLIGGVAAYLTVTAESLGRGALLAAPIFGLCALAGTLVGEHTVPAPDGAIRRAQLRVRRVRDYVPPLLGPAVVAAAVILVVLASVTTAVASADDMGRAGRDLLCSTGAASGPWPGSFYTVPGLGLVLAGLLLAGLSLRRIVIRPQAADTTTVDEVRRRRSTEVVTAAVGILVLVPLLGVALTSGAALISLAGPCGHGWWTGAGWGLIGLGGAAFVLAMWCIVLLLLPSPRLHPGNVE